MQLCLSNKKLLTVLILLVLKPKYYLNELCLNPMMNQYENLLKIYILIENQCSKF